MHKKQFLSIISKSNIFLGILSIALGLLYFTLPSNLLLYDVFGYIMLCSWGLSIFLVYFGDKHIIKSTEIGKKINRTAYYFIVAFIVATLLLLFGIIFTTFILRGILQILGTIMNISGFFLISIYILYFSVLMQETINKEGVWNFD